METKDKSRGPFAWIIVFALVFCGIAIGGCGKDKGQRQQVAPEVVVVTLAQQQIELTTELPGRTVAYRIAEVRPQVGGIIRECLFREGSDVQAGQALYQIDPSTYQAAFDNAKAALGRAEANLPAIQSREERYRDLLDSRAVS